MAGIVDISGVEVANPNASSPPSGPAGGDLSGTYPNPTVVNGSNITNGSIANSALANSTITLGSTAMSLGGTYSTIAGALIFSGSLQYKALVSLKASTPYAVVTADSAAVFTNEGATAQIVFNLPTAVANLTYTFIVQDSDGIRINAASGDTIRLAANVSAAAGNTTSVTVGSTVTLVAINATEWIATSIVGTWVTT